MNRNKILSLSILTFVLVGLIALFSQAANPAHAETEAVNANNWETAIEISTGATRAQRPSIAASPDGKTILVTYVAPSNDDSVSDIKYSYSTQNGKLGSWTRNQAVHPSTAKKSEQTHVTFDQNGKAHVVWVEDTRLAYANSANLSSGFENFKYFSTSPAIPGALNPYVITYGNNVHIIWSEGDTGNPGPNIKHVQSTNGGTSWGAVTFVVNNGVKTEKPSVAVDDEGNLYLVYQQQTISPTHNNILYLKGTFNNSTLSWSSTPTDITSKIVGNPEGAFTMVEPSIMYNNGRLEVSVTQKYDAATSREARQFIYHITCANSCEDKANWQPKLIQDGATSALYIDISPNNLAASIVRLGSCTTIIFDGKPSSGQVDKERIFSSGSCSNWGNNRQDLTPTIGESRAIQPTAVIQNSWWMYVVYEQFENEDQAEKIYFMRNIPGVYLPVVLKAK